MLESLSCPSCFTHYGLRPERVRLGIRRARCFQCEGIFDIEEAVQRLLAPVAPCLAETSATETLEGIKPEDLLELDMALTTEPTPAPEPPLELPLEDSALTLGDLEGSEDEILEKTLVIDPPAPELVPPSEETTDGGGFSSAKDAIAKLLGDGPAPASDRRSSGRGSSMDVEATLDALENTLGGTPAKDLAGRSASPQVEFPKPAGMGSTVRLSSSELQAAMAAGASGGAPPSETPTVAIPSQVSTRPAFVPQPQASTDTNLGAPNGDPNLLKVQVGQETFQNVSLEQLTTWIEQGRVQDWHMVARQFSDNWIEAGKVPSLRPVFERIRRISAQTNPGAPLDAPGAFESAPVKKGLFGWMSNRN